MGASKQQLKTWSLHALFTGNFDKIFQEEFWSCYQWNNSLFTSIVRSNISFPFYIIEKIKVKSANWIGDYNHFDILCWTDVNISSPTILILMYTSYMYFIKWTFFFSNILNCRLLILEINIIFLQAHVHV